VITSAHASDRADDHPFEQHRDPDALLAAVGGPLGGQRLGPPRWASTTSTSPATSPRSWRDDGEVNPAVQVDIRDSATPRDMVKLLAGLYQGQWLSASSRKVIIGAMERCRTGVGRIRARCPATCAWRTRPAR
jgi:beta-lactamase class A